MTDRDSTSTPLVISTPLLVAEYQLLERLGSGGMADVYRAHDARRDRFVAIKVLRPEVAQAAGTDRFRREIELVSRLAHPNILPLLDSGQTVIDGRTVHWYVMPLVIGETLQDRIRRETRLGTAQAIRIVRDILDALQYAHAQGVIHRDIKPSNIMLSGERALLADFGIARAAQTSSSSSSSDEHKSLTDSGVIVGTPAYMSPEQGLGDKRIDARTDIFSLGCVLYEMITGVQPFDAPTAQSIISRKLDGRFVPVEAMRPTAPPGLDTILMRALAPEPAERFASAEEFARELDEPNLKSPPTRWRKTRIERMVIAAGVVLSLVMLSIQWLGDRTPAAAAAPDKSRIAVLPLEVLDADSTLNHVALALHSDLIDELSQFRALTVISRNGVMPLRGASVQPDSIARQFQVGSIVTGDMRRLRDTVVVSVRLIDAATNVQVARVVAAGSSHELLALRSTVLDSVTTFLRKEIGALVVADRNRHAVGNTEAWELVSLVKSQGMQLSQTQRLSPFERRQRFAAADSMLMRAARLDEGWPTPLVEAARLHLVHANSLEAAAQSTPRAEAGAPLDTSLTPTGLRLRAIQMAERALARNKQDAEALHMRGKARFELWRGSSTGAADSLRVGATQDLERAVEIRRDLAAAWNDLGWLLQQSGEYNEAHEAAGAALRADAYLERADAVMGRLFFTSLATGRTSEARDWCERGQQRYPRDPRFWGCELTILGWTGTRPDDVARAWLLLESAEARDSANLLAAGRGTRRLLVAAVAARAGLIDSARAIAIAARQVSPGPLSLQADYGEAYVQTLLGNGDSAVVLLGRFLEANPAFRPQVRQHPWFAPLRGDARFQRLTASSR